VIRPFSILLCMHERSMCCGTLSKVVGFIIPILLSLFFVGSASKLNSAPVYVPTIVDKYPHDKRAFTQGLVYDSLSDGVLYESTGLVGRSSVRKVQLQTGSILQQYNVPRVFAEGLTLWEEMLFQLTWRDGTVFVYNKNNFSLTQEFRNPANEGWGLTHDDTDMIMSDGSNFLYFIDPKTFTVKKKLKVLNGNAPVIN